MMEFLTTVSVNSRWRRNQNHLAVVFLVIETSNCLVITFLLATLLLTAFLLATTVTAHDLLCLPLDLNQLFASSTPLVLQPLLKGFALEDLQADKCIAHIKQYLATLGPMKQIRLSEEQKLDRFGVVYMVSVQNRTLHEESVR